MWKMDNMNDQEIFITKPGVEFVFDTPTRVVSAQCHNNDTKTTVIKVGMKLLDGTIKTIVDGIGTPGGAVSQSKNIYDFKPGESFIWQQEEDLDAEVHLYCLTNFIEEEFEDAKWK